jgi:hypothetical protein
MTRFPRTFIALIVLAAASGCARRVDLEKVPMGARVEVTRQDGGVVRGTLDGRDDRDLQLTVGSARRSIPRDQITDLRIVDETTAPVSLPSAARFREYTLPAGATLTAQLNSSLGSNTSRVNDPVEAALTQTERVDGVDVLPVGSVIRGVVTTANRDGSGRASLAVRFQSVSVPGGETYPLSAGLQHTAESTTGDNVKKIGIPAAGGAILGALIGGKKGAGIGAVIGGGAGAAVVLTSSGPEVRYGQGTVVSLRLDQAIDVRVPIRR